MVVATVPLRLVIVTGGGSCFTWEARAIEVSVRGAKSLSYLLVLFHCFLFYVFSELLKFCPVSSLPASAVLFLRKPLAPLHSDDVIFSALFFLFVLYAYVPIRPHLAGHGAVGMRPPLTINLLLSL